MGLNDLTELLNQVLKASTTTQYFQQAHSYFLKINFVIFSLNKYIKKLK
jgi:hypothetical protein